MKGIVTTIQIQGIDERALAEAGGGDVVNMRRDAAGRWMTSWGVCDALTREGETPLAETLSWARVDAVTAWSQRGARRRWLLWEAIGYAVDGDDVSVETETSLLMAAAPGAWDAPLELASLTQTRTGVWMFPVGEWLWIVNGVDRPRRWNGDRLEVIGFEAAPAAPRPRTVMDGLVVPRDPLPPVALESALYDDARARGVGPTIVNPGGASSGVERFQFWRYGYAVADVNDLGQEGPLSPIAWAVGYSSAVDYASPEPSRTLVVVDLDERPPDVAGVRLYRTINLAPVEADPTWESNTRDVRGSIQSLQALDRQTIAPLRLVAEIPGGVGLSFVDGRPDAELGGPPPYTGVLPMRAHLGLSFSGRVFLADEDGALWVSEPFRPEQFGGLRFELGARASAMVSASGALFIFTPSSTYMVRAGAEPVLETLSTTFGCVGPRAVADVAGLGVVFVDVSGPKVIARAGETFGSAPLIGALDAEPGQRSRIAASWDSVRAADLERSVVTVHVPDREVWIYVEAEELELHELLVFHTDIGQWSRRTGMRLTSAATLDDERRTLVYGSATQDIGVLAVVPGSDMDESGERIVGQIETARLSADQFAMSVPTSIVIRHLASNREVTVEMLRDVDQEWTEIGTLGASEAALAGDFVRDGLGLAAWDPDASWSPYPEVLERVDITGRAVWDARFRISGERLAVVELGVFVAPDAAAAGRRPPGGG